MKTVTMYSSPTCHFCHATREFFKENNIDFTDYDVLADEVRRAEMFERSGQMSVPVIFVDDKMVVGFDQPKLKELLSV